MPQSPGACKALSAPLDRTYGFAMKLVFAWWILVVAVGLAAMFVIGIAGL